MKRQNGWWRIIAGANTMTNMPLTAKLQKRIAKEMAAGKYRSADEMMVKGD